MAVIDVGPGATNRAATQTTLTLIDLGNPANADGNIDTVLLWFNSNGSGVKAGMFYLVSGTTYKCRSAVSIGDVASGSEQTFSGLTMACITGDYIGNYRAGGAIEKDTAGGDGLVYKSDDHVVVDDQNAYSAAAGWASSIYATGTTGASAPTVTSQAATLVGSTTCTGNGNITVTGGENCTVRGVCYSSVTNPPTTADSKVQETGSHGTGAFTEALTGLTQNTLYYARAFATNSADTSYGDVVTFTTHNLVSQDNQLQKVFYEVLNGTTILVREDVTSLSAEDRATLLTTLKADMASCTYRQHNHPHHIPQTCTMDSL